jgi:hypothetical protein
LCPSCPDMAAFLVNSTMRAQHCRGKIQTRRIKLPLGRMHNAGDILKIGLVLTLTTIIPVHALKLSQYVHKPAMHISDFNNTKLTGQISDAIANRCICPTWIPENSRRSAGWIQWQKAYPTSSYPTRVNCSAFWTARRAWIPARCCRRTFKPRRRVCAALPPTTALPPTPNPDARAQSHPPSKLSPTSHHRRRPNSAQLD